MPLLQGVARSRMLLRLQLFANLPSACERLFDSRSAPSANRRTPVYLGRAPSADWRRSVLCFRASRAGRWRGAAAGMQCAASASLKRCAGAQIQPSRLDLWHTATRIRPVFLRVAGTQHCCERSDAPPLFSDKYKYGCDDPKFQNAGVERDGSALRKDLHASVTSTSLTPYLSTTARLPSHHARPTPIQLPPGPCPAVSHK
jgi:hypothetical protein